MNAGSHKTGLHIRRVKYMMSRRYYKKILQKKKSIEKTIRGFGNGNGSKSREKILAPHGIKTASHYSDRKYTDAVYSFLMQRNWEKSAF